MDKMDGNLSTLRHVFFFYQLCRAEAPAPAAEAFSSAQFQAGDAVELRGAGIGAQKGFVVVVVVVAVDIGISGGDAKRGVMAGTFELNPVHRRKCYCNTTYISQTLEEL